MRSMYEHFIDNVTNKEFGSDGMPTVNFFGKFSFPLQFLVVFFTHSLSQVLRYTKSVSVL
jgi:hypothetical protein